MGEFVPNPNLAARIFHARQKNQPPDLKDNLIGNNLMNSRNFNFQQPSIDGKRNGIPHGQATDYFVQQKLQSNPYIRGMHPYTSNMMVDIAPSVYNTNPLAGTGGYEHNLASFNGTRPLATALDEPQEMAQRAYEDVFKMSAKNPLSMQFTLNHSVVDRAARGEMYDAFRLGLDRNNQPEPDYDTVLQSKVNKGYKEGFVPIGDSNRNVIENYLQNQKPLRTGDFNRGVNRIIKHYTPGTVQQLAAQAGIPANQVAAGGANFIQPALQNQLQNQQNQVQVNQNLNGPVTAPITKWYENEDFDLSNFLFGDYQAQVTASDPLMNISHTPLPAPKKARKNKSNPDFSSFVPPNPQYVEHTPLLNQNTPQTPYTDEFYFRRSNAPDMKANPRQTMSYNDFSESAQKKQPVRGQVKEMISQYEDNLKKGTQNQSPAEPRSRYSANLNNLEPFYARPRTPARPASEQKERASKIPTPTAKRTRKQTQLFDPSKGY
jgi:hypothetical protein